METCREEDRRWEGEEKGEDKSGVKGSGEEERWGEEEKGKGKEVLGGV